MFAITSGLLLVYHQGHLIRDGAAALSFPNLPSDDRPLDSTQALLVRVRAGDHAALDALLARYLGPLRRWASGRLPRWARDLRDTDDLVQETLLASLRHLATFEMRQDGALHAYLRQSIANRITDEVRRVGRRPAVAAADETIEARGPSPLEEVIGSDALARYEQGLTRLSSSDREAVIARVELGLGYQEIAEALGKGSADAARMAVSRALLKLAEEMSHG